MNSDILCTAIQQYINQCLHYHKAEFVGDTLEAAAAGLGNGRFHPGLLGILVVSFCDAILHRAQILKAQRLGLTLARL